jgi:hypothetical protein
VVAFLALKASNKKSGDKSLEYAKPVAGFVGRLPGIPTKPIAGFYVEHTSTTRIQRNMEAGIRRGNL